MFKFIQQKITNYKKNKQFKKEICQKFIETVEYWNEIREIEYIHCGEKEMFIFNQYVNFNIVIDTHVFTYFYDLYKNIPINKNYYHYNFNFGDYNKYTIDIYFKDKTFLWNKEVLYKNEWIIKEIIE